MRDKTGALYVLSHQEHILTIVDCIDRTDNWQMMRIPSNTHDLQSPAAPAP